MPAADVPPPGAASSVGPDVPGAPSAIPQAWQAAVGAARGQYGRQVSATLGTRLLLLALGFATTIVVTRVLGPSGRGLYAAAVTITAIGVQMGTLGLQTTNTYTAARSPAKLGALLGNTLALSLGVGGLACLLVWSVVALVVPQASPVGLSLLGGALLGVPVGLAYILLQSLLVGVGDIAAYNVIDIGVKALGLGLVVLVLVTRPVSVDALYLAAVVSVAAGAVLAMRRLVNRTGARPRADGVVFGETFRYGFKVYLASFFAFLALRSQLLLVEGLLGAEAAGYYSVAVTIADLLYVLPTVVGTILFPRLLRTTDAGQRLRMTRVAAGQVAGVMAVAVLGAAAVAGVLVTLLFGDEFAPAVPALLWLLPGILFLSVNTIFFNYLSALGMPWFAVGLPGAAATATLGLSAALLPPLGIRGAAIASTVSYGFMLLGSLAYTRRAR